MGSWVAASSKERQFPGPTQCSDLEEQAIEGREDNVGIKGTDNGASHRFDASVKPLALPVRSLCPVPPSATDGVLLGIGNKERLHLVTSTFFGTWFALAGVL